MAPSCILGPFKKSIDTGCGLQRAFINFWTHKNWNETLLNGFEKSIKRTADIRKLFLQSC